MRTIAFWVYVGVPLFWETSKSSTLSPKLPGPSLTSGSAVCRQLRAMYMCGSKGTLIFSRAPVT